MLEDRLRQMGACVGDVARRRRLDLLHEGLGALDDRLREMRREFDVPVEPDRVRGRRRAAQRDLRLGLDETLQLLHGLDVRELHDAAVGEALLPQQRVLERRDHKYGDENNH